jgi:hypothetical protein
MYSVSYQLNPGDPAWVLDKNSVKKGTCVQSQIKVVPIVPTTNTNYQTIISYIILLECNAGTVTVLDQNVYLTLDAAIAALQANIESATCTPQPYHQYPFPTPPCYFSN